MALASCRGLDDTLNTKSFLIGFRDSREEVGVSGEFAWLDAGVDVEAERAWLDAGVDVEEEFALCIGNNFGLNIGGGGRSDDDGVSPADLIGATCEFGLVWLEFMMDCVW